MPHTPAKEEMYTIDVFIDVPVTAIPTLISKLVFDSIELIQDENGVINSQEVRFYEHTSYYNEHYRLLLHQKAISEGDPCQACRRLFEVRFLAAEQEETSISRLPVYARPPLGSRDETHCAE